MWWTANMTVSLTPPHVRKSVVHVAIFSVQILNKRAKLVLAVLTSCLRALGHLTSGGLPSVSWKNEPRAWSGVRCSPTNPYGTRNVHCREVACPKRKKFRLIEHLTFTKKELTCPEDCVNHFLHFEAKTFLHVLLVVEDKLSMVHGLETRVPYTRRGKYRFNEPIRL